MLGVFFHLNAEVATRIGISPPALNGVNMGLIRYLRRRLHIQQLNDVCDSIHQITDQCLKEICSNSGIQAKLDQTIQTQKSLRDTGEAILLKAEQAAGYQQLTKKTDHTIAMQEQLGQKVDQTIAGQQELLNRADNAKVLQQELGKKVDQTLSGQQLLKGAVEAASAKLEQISALQLKVNDTEFSRRSQILFADNRYWEDNFYKSIKGIDIEEKYDRLVNGLSDADRSVVDSIIGRVQHLCEDGDTACYLPDESERIYRNLKENLRIVKLSDHCFVYKNFKLPINFFETSTFACNYGLDLIDRPKYADGKDIIDAGAYIGDSALVFGRFFSKCRRIYAFEPDPDSYALMEKTIAMNRLANVIPVGVALGDANCSGELSARGLGGNLLDRSRGDGHDVLPVKIIRFDDYATQNNIVPGVIKTDLEGFEMHFLRGALETIKKYRPILVLSIYHSADDFFGIKPFIEDLDLDYHFRFFKADDGMILGGTCLLCIPE